MPVTTAESDYLGFIRSRPCTVCGNPNSEPHHAIRRLPGISEARLAQKGSDFLSIPLCNLCHTKLHRGIITLSREEVLEFCLINLICFLEAFRLRQKHPNEFDAVCREAAKPAREDRAKESVEESAV